MEKTVSLTLLLVVVFLANYLRTTGLGLAANERVRTVSKLSPGRIR